MRKRLASDKGLRKKFRAVFSRFGKKANYHGYAEQTVLLTRVTDAETNIEVTDHVWFTYTQGFAKVALRPGITVEFEARVKAYKKGYVNRKYSIDKTSEDYKLSHPTRIALIKEPEKGS